MEFRLVFIVFFTAHCLGRYAFPPKLALSSWGAYLSSLVFYCFSLLLVFAPALYSVTMYYAIMMMVFYLLISFFCFLVSRKKERNWFFFFTEILETAFILAIAYVYTARWDSLSPWRDIRAILDGLSLDYSQVMSYIALLVLLLPFSNVLIKKILPEKGEVIAEERHFKGSFLGSIERVLYALCLYTGGVVLMGLIFLTKIFIFSFQMRKSPIWGYRLYAGSILSMILAMLSFYLVQPFIHF